MNYFRIALPEESDGSRFERCGLSHDISHNTGFIFSLFGEHMPVFSIPPLGDDNSCDESVSDSEITSVIAENNNYCAFRPPVSTPRSTHLELVEHIVAHLGAVDTGSAGIRPKIVAARIAVEPLSREVPEIYRRLRDNYRDAAVFLFSSPLTGTWIGASPELLLSADSRGIATVALAGTRPAHDDSTEPGEWDLKNREEQQTVTDFILQLLRDKGYRPTAGAPYTRRAVRVEHICTDITAPCTAPRFSIYDAMELASVLAPTPALSGFPRHEAVQFINCHENGPRLCYGGIIGYSTPQWLRAYANLRSGRILGDSAKIALYAGGGITRHSDPASEWQETERKLTTLLPHI